MALDPDLTSMLTGMIVSDAKAMGAQIQVASTNLVQGLGVIHNTLIQGNATPQQDAALRTAIHVPSADGIGTALPK